MSAPLRQIGMRQLRSELANVVASAVGGERIAITVRGRQVAVLGPNEPNGGAPDLDTLANSGLIEPPRRRDRPSEPPPHVLPADVRLDRVIDQVRGRA